MSMTVDAGSSRWFDRDGIGDDPPLCGADRSEPADATAPAGQDGSADPIVMLCSQNADYPGIGELAGLLGMKHQWLKTSSKEAGMGPTPGQDCDDCPYQTQTSITDQSGRSTEPGAECFVVSSADEACVDRALDIGRDLGTWTVSNQCNAFVARVLESCSTVPPEPREFDPVASGAGMR